MQKQGSALQFDYYQNIGGINNSDSPFIVSPNHCYNSKNAEYYPKGGFRKRLGASKVNTSADTELTTFGLGLRRTFDDTKTTIRAAGTKIQSLAISSGAFTNLSEDDSSVGTDFLGASTDIPVKMTMFNTSTVGVLWMAGGGMDDIYGAYSTSKITSNGVPIPTGAISGTGTGTGSGLASGTYYLAVAYRKTSTQAISNAVLDAAVTISSDQNIDIDLSGLTNVDTTKFDKVYIYLSAVGGSSDFTTGDLILQTDITTSNPTYTGTPVLSNQNVPRSGNTTLDNSDLPSGTFKTMTLFKRRLVTADEGTLYISDLNKPESWPAHNVITIPSGGPITGLATLSFTTPTSSNLDEYLVIFKEREMWVLTGTGTVTNSLPDWSLTFIDFIGTNSQTCIVNANGYIAWLSQSGVYIWDGSDKPIYASKLIEMFFTEDGDIDKSKLYLSWGIRHDKTQQIIWYLSHKIYGEQMFAIKMDMRLTLPQATRTANQRLLEAVFTTDTFDSGLYAGDAQIPSGESSEIFLVGDDAGFVRKMYNSTADDFSGIEFEYETPFLDQGMPNTRKNYTQIIAWFDDVGNWDITLDYWTDYRISESEKSTVQAKIPTNVKNSTALFDVADFDVANFDNYESRMVPVVFNLNSTKNNTMGDCIKLKIKQQEADKPTICYGWSIVCTPVGETK